MKITRDVINDLWPLYASNEASAETRALVEEFLRDDPEFARRLREDQSARLLEPVPVARAQDHELKALTKTRRLLVLHEWPLFFAIMFSCFAFGRIVSDTSWDVSPRNFAITAGIAAVFWILFLARLVLRVRALR